MSITYTDSESDLFGTLLIEIIEQNGPLSKFSIESELAKRYNQFYKEKPNEYSKTRIGAVISYVNDMIRSKGINRS